MKIVNGGLMKNPINWLIVWFMLLIAGMAGHFILRAANVECPHDSGN